MLSRNMYLVIKRLFLCNILVVSDGSDAKQSEITKGTSTTKHNAMNLSCQLVLWRFILGWDPDCTD
jgi:hypothetical protein